MNGSALLARAADALVRDYMSVRRDEQVVITADTDTDAAATSALCGAINVSGASVTVCTIPRLPYQGMLADPFVPRSLVAAIRECDVWFDLTFPYLAGSSAHDAAMKTQHVRCLLLADLGGVGIANLFGKVDFDQLFAIQTAMDELIARSEGANCRVTCPAGTDFAFAIGKTSAKKPRRAQQPGTYTPPGSAVMYPKAGTMSGVIVLSGVFHEYHLSLREPIRIHVNETIESVSGGGNELPIFERALRRASGGKYGSVIHLTHGFHPSARFSGRSFIEDIRARGNNAIGFGIPWWEPGGGENHPDGVVAMQSLWIADQPIVQAGAIVGPPSLAQLEKDLYGS